MTTLDIATDIVCPPTDLWSDEPPVESDLHLQQIPWECWNFLRDWWNDVEIALTIQRNPPIINLTPPIHVLTYQNDLHSYREFPLRWAELGTVYRYERSGVDAINRYARSFEL